MGSHSRCQPSSTWGWLRFHPRDATGCSRRNHLADFWRETTFYDIYFRGNQ